ncbi:acyl-CoA dehydrogenase family protein [Candidatus Zixiibacteriota bacterium]
MWWDKKYESFRAEIREFAEKTIRPIAERMVEEGTFDISLLPLLHERGLLSMILPKKYGGAEFDTLEYTIGVEEVSRVCGSTGITLAACNSLGIFPILAFGTEGQKEKYLRPVGERGALIAFGLTEPNAGSDAGGTKTTAVLKGDKWILNGSKCFITNPSISDFVVATARTDNKGDSHDISSFIVDKSFPGFSVGKKEDKLGLRGSDTAMLHFEDAEVPQENLLGKVGEGFKQFMITLDGGRISIGAMALGLGQGAYDLAAEYADTHPKIGKPLAYSQATAFKLADMATRLEAARHLVYTSAVLKDRKQPFSKQSAMAKLDASEVGRFCGYEAIGIMGLDGYDARYQVERIWRDVKLCEIGEGTSEIQRLVISRALAKERQARRSSSGG